MTFQANTTFPRETTLAKWFLAAALVFVFLADTLADTVLLKDGGTISGKVEETSDEVVITIRPGMTVSVKKAERVCR